MRAKVLIVVLSVAALAGIIVWFSGAFRSTAPSITPDVVITSSKPVLPSASQSKTPAKESIPTNPKLAETQTGEEEIRAQKVRQRIAELNDLAMNSDTNSLNTILSELTNSDKEIRKGALDATIQFADRAAIPRLQEIADRTQDATEKA